MMEAVFFLEKGESIPFFYDKSFTDLSSSFLFKCFLSSQAWEYIYEKIVCRHPTPWFVGAEKILHFLHILSTPVPELNQRFSIPGGFARDWADFAGLGNLARLHTLGMMFEAVGEHLFNIALFADNYESCLGSFIAYLTQRKYHNILYFDVPRFFAWVFFKIPIFSNSFARFRVFHSVPFWSWYLCDTVTGVAKWRRKIF